LPEEEQPANEAVQQRDVSHRMCVRKSMKFLWLAYGDERDWKNLTREQQEILLK
jgi:hypothetical protein